MAAGTRRAEQRCAECASPLAQDQRYCLSCGARVGERDPRVAAMMGRARDCWTPEPLARPALDSESDAPSRDERRSTLLPSRRLSVGLVTAFLGFGVLLGAAAASNPAGQLSARSAAPLKLLLPAGTGNTATTPAASPSAGAEPPAAEPEATPEPSSASTTPAAAATASPSKPAAPSGSGGGSEPEGSGGASSTAPATKLPPIKHVFMIVLSDVAYATAFGPASASHYLSSTLEGQGELLGHYDAVAHEELANEVALLSGQGPTVQSAANCAQYSPIQPGTVTASEQVAGSGCVYPAGTQTLPNQLAAKHLSWHAYVEGMDEPGPAAGPCSHPQLGQSDPTAAQTASTGPYATFRNPFVYFASLTGSQACARNDVGIGPLASALAKPATTPAFAYIVPDRCHDGNPTPCTAGAPAGMAAADRFLQRIVPEITASTAYKESGLLVITTDEAPSSGEFADSSSCCGQPTFGNLPAPVGGVARRGGGDVGALLLSPYVKGGTTSQEPFSHFSTLRTIEDLFSLRHLGYAALPAVTSLPPALFLAKRAH